MTAWAFIPAVVLLAGAAAAQSAPSKAKQSQTYESADLNEDGNLRIITSDHQTIIIPKGSNQRSFEAPSISGDHTAAGALELYENDATSYDVPLGLTVYANGKLHSFSGHGLMIAADWHFVDGGRRVAYGVTTVHGNCVVGWELWDIARERLVESAKDKRQCDDDSGRPIPNWIEGATSRLK